MIVHRTPFHIRALKRHVPLPLVYFDNYDNGNCRKINTYYGSIKRNHNLKLTRIIEETEKEFGGKPEFTRKTAIYIAHIIHKCSTNRPGIRRGRAFERIFLPIFLRYVSESSRGKNLGAQRE